jgi:hypothetical protein
VSRSLSSKMLPVSPVNVFRANLLFILILHTAWVRGKTESSDRTISTTSVVTELSNGTIVNTGPVPLPSRFHYYDLDRDGVLTLKELAKATGTNRKDARLPFEAADSDGKQ